MSKSVSTAVVPALTYTSRYNVFNDDGTVRFVAGDLIDEAEARRQGIIATPTTAPTEG